MYPNQLNQVGVLNAADLVILWASAQNQTRSAPVQLFTDAAVDATIEALKQQGALSDLGVVIQSAKPTSTVRAGVLMQPAIANIAAAPTAAQYNAILTALRNSGLLSAT